MSCHPIRGLRVPTYEQGKEERRMYLDIASKEEEGIREMLPVSWMPLWAKGSVRRRQDPRLEKWLLRETRTMYTDLSRRSTGCPP
jgi:hypothetical protein